MCATHNITKSTKEIITRELKRGGDIADRIMMGKAQWKGLFVRHTFFTEGYKYYLSVISASTTRDAQNIWSGLVESKVRLLVVGLEGHSSIALAHPFNKGLERVLECKSDEEIEKAKNGSLEFQMKEEPNEKSKPDQTDALANGSKTTFVYTTTHYIGLELQEGKCSLYS
jgi:poly(A) polymerase